MKQGKEGKRTGMETGRGWKRSEEEMKENL